MLNTAQQLVMKIVEGGNSLRDYKAPHAYRGTPPRKHFPRIQRANTPAERALTGRYLFRP